MDALLTLGHLLNEIMPTSTTGAVLIIGWCAFWLVAIMQDALRLAQRHLRRQRGAFQQR